MRKSDFSKIPSVDSILQWDEIISILYENGHLLTKKAIDYSLSLLRKKIADGTMPNDINSFLKEKIDESIHNLTECSLKRVINGTGIVIHTNLGRAVMSEDVMDHVSQVCSHYCNLEYDLEKGSRGHRDIHAERLLSLFFNVESACVVNNNAAAVMLVLNTFAEGKEVIVSRGELVEIGGSFRIPEVMKKAGGKLIEVGSTNKTHLEDYENAITDNTGLILKVHPSNYRISGFTDSVKAVDLSVLCKKKNIPFIEDMGSGNIYDLKPFGMLDEPVVDDSLKSGIDVVTFSGDKLFGGVQAGIIIGSKDLVSRIKKNHLLRALRVDKMVYAALEKQLLLFLKARQSKIPVNTMLYEEVKSIKQRVDAFVNSLDSDIQPFLNGVTSKAKIGGGTTPEHDFDSYALEIKHSKLSVNAIEKCMRQCNIPVIGRIEKNSYLLDFRTIMKSDMEILKANVKQLFKI